MNYFNDIAHIIAKDTNAKQAISHKSLTEIFYMTTNNEELKKYIKFLVFTETCDFKGTTTASYYIPEKIVFIYNEGINKYKKEMKKAVNLYGGDLYLFLNESIVEVLLHEIEHVKQMKYLSESTIYDTKYEILRASNPYNFNKNYLHMPYLERYYGGSLAEHFGSKYNKFKKQINKVDYKYEKLYDFDPSEINAEYQAMKSIIAINDCLPSSNRIRKAWLKLVTNFISNLYLDKKDELICPLKSYLKKRNKILTLDKVRMRDLNTNLPLDERISFGMPIKGKEYDTLDTYFKKHL